MSTTRWIDTKEKDLDNALRLLLDDVSPDEKSGAITWDDWHLTLIFPQNKQISYNGRNITYNMVRYEYNQISAGDLPIEDRTTPKKGFIIAYKAESFINYIIDENSSAQKLLRRLMSYNGRNEIEKNTFNFTNDFFVWLINRVYNQNGLIETATTDEAHIQLKSIKGFRGDVDDLQTRVSATGESVTNIISTLSFLLENNSLKQIHIDLSRNDHESIKLTLQRDTVSIIDKDYQGIYESESIDELLSKLYLMVYLEILPILIQEYNTDISNEEWNQENFLRTIAEELKSKIEDKIAFLKESIMLQNNATR